jgi:hypothetical protein
LKLLTLTGTKTMTGQIVRTAVLAATALTLSLGTAAFAASVTYKTSLKGSEEVPANTAKGTGTVDATVDTATKKMTYTVTYSGLTGPATAAHFHAPAEAGKNAPPVITMTELKSPIKGTATLTDAQLKDLQDGKMYFNVHTAEHKGGEIRGQLVK